MSTTRPRTRPATTVAPPSASADSSWAALLVDARRRPSEAGERLGRDGPGELVLRDAAGPHRPLMASYANAAAAASTGHAGVSKSTSALCLGARSGRISTAQIVRGMSARHELPKYL